MSSVPKWSIALRTKAFACSRIAHVGGKGQHLAPRFPPDQLRRLVQMGIVEGADRDLRPLPCEFQGDRPPQPHAPAGNERHLSLQSQIHTVLLRSFVSTNLHRGDFIPDRPPAVNRRRGANSLLTSPCFCSKVRPISSAGIPENERHVKKGVSSSGPASPGPPVAPRSSCDGEEARRPSFLGKGQSRKSAYPKGHGWKNHGLFY